MQKITLPVIILMAIVAFLILIGLALVLSLFFVEPAAPVPMSLAGKIALIPIKGDITMEDPGTFSGYLSNDDIVEAIKLADADPTIGAIVFEINSGGGSIVAAKQITQAIQNCDKPTIAYISEVGASAAYYIAASTDEIMADEDSITGSLGVIAVFPNIKGLMEKLGIEVVMMHEGEFKTMGNMFEDFNGEAKEIMQSILVDTYQRFKNDIREFRGEKLNPVRFEEIADGRILSGHQALQYGLVDSLGTKEDALDKAAELAGIEFYTVDDFSMQGIGLFDLFTGAGASFANGFKTGLKANNVSLNS
jgi:protease-4